VNSTAESVYRRSISELVTEAGCASPEACLLTFHFGDPTDGPTNWLPLSTIKEAVGIQNSNVHVRIV